MLSYHGWQTSRISFSNNFWTPQEQQIFTCNRFAISPQHTPSSYLCESNYIVRLDHCAARTADAIKNRLAISPEHACFIALQSWKIVVTLLQQHSQNAKRCLARNEITENVKNMQINAEICKSQTQPKTQTSKLRSIICRLQNTVSSHPSKQHDFRSCLFCFSISIVCPPN